MSTSNIDKKHNQKDETSFDPDFLAKKYLEERDKRLREDGNDQYLEIKGEFSYFAEDPYVEEEIQRKPLEDEVEVIIIGAGFGGMVCFNDKKIYDKAKLLRGWGRSSATFNESESVKKRFDIKISGIRYDKKYNLSSLIE